MDTRPGTFGASQHGVHRTVEAGGPNNSPAETLMTAGDSAGMFRFPSQVFSPVRSS